MSAADDHTGKNQRGKAARLIILVGLILVVLTLAAFVGRRFASETPQKGATARQTILQKVGEIYILPSDDTPTVAAIQNKAKLPDQPFFKNAHEGDYLIVYPKKQLALLYRESVGKLVNVGPVTLPAN